MHYKSAIKTWGLNSINISHASNPSSNYFTYKCFFTYKNGTCPFIKVFLILYNFSISTSFRS